MAKVKVQTARQIKKRKDADLKEPDEVLTQLQKLSEHLSEHFKKYAIGLAVVLSLSIGINLFMNSRHSAAVERSVATQKAATAVSAPVATVTDEKLFSLGAPPTEEPKGPELKDEAARWEASLAAIAEARDNSDDELKLVLSGLEARVKLAQGKPGDAAKALAEYTKEAEENDPLLPIILENQGRAAEAGGDVAAAAGFYDKLASQKNLYWSVRGYMALGDLYNPRGGAGKDAAKARASYDKALDALKPSDTQVIKGSLRQLRSEVKRRASLIEG